MIQIKEIWHPQRYVVINCNYQGKEYVLEASEVGKKGNILKESQFFDTLDDVIAYFGKNKTYWLHAEGSGVLSRIVDGQSDFKRDLILNGDPEEFYFTSVSTSSSRLVSFLRKSVTDEIIHYFESNKLFLVGFSCGFSPFGMLVEEEKGFSLDYRIELVNGVFENLERQDSVRNRIEYQGEFLNKSDLLARALFGISNETKVLETFQFEKSFQENKEYNQFKYIGVTALTFIFIVVVGNYFYLNSLNNQVANKEADLSLSNSNLSILDNLEQEEIRKEQLVFNSGLTTHHFMSYYLDKIGKDVPKSIRLSELYAFPLTEKLKEKRKVEIDKTKVELLGWTGSNVILDDWMETLNRNEWVKSVELMSYHKLPNGEAAFKLYIFLMP